MYIMKITSTLSNIQMGATSYFSQLADILVSSSSIEIALLKIRAKSYEYIYSRKKKCLINVIYAIEYYMLD